MKPYVLGMMCLGLGLSAYSQQTARGIVFEDKNLNKVLDKGEKGLPGVAVSNGKEVVLTGKDGAYELPVQQDNILFVIKPAQYRSHLNENNLPISYYIHKPQGSPAHFKYPGAQPTGDLPAAVNFAMIPEKSNDDFTAFVFGDPQPYTMQELAHFEKGIIDEARQHKNVSFGISLGDLVGDHLDLQLPYAQTMKKMDLPWYNVMGNHDMNYDAKTDSLSDETFERNFGPANYAFNYGKAHFIVLDNILYPDPRDEKGYWGGFRADQLAFVKNDLKQVPKENLVVISFHIPLLITGNDEFIRQHRQELFDALKGYENVLVLSAHTHLQMHNFYTITDGWHNVKPLHEFNIGTTSGDWYSGELNAQGIPVSTMRDGTPKGYGFLNIKGNQYVLDYKVAGQPASHQISIYSPKVVQQNQRTSAGIFANFFLGTDNDAVHYRIDGNNWKPMKKVNNADPAFLEKLMRFDQTETLLSGRRPSNAEACTHLWRGNVPTDLSAGQHTIEIKATDMFGREYTQTSNYTIQTQPQ